MSYTKQQVMEALKSAGLDHIKIDQILSESTVNYEGPTVEGPDPEGQETYDPRAPAEKEWADMHTVEVFDLTPDAPKPAVSFDRIRKMMGQ